MGRKKYGTVAGLGVGWWWRLLGELEGRGDIY